MAETVLVTQLEFLKGEAVFPAAEDFRVQSVPRDEQQIAEAVLAQNCRAVIVGTDSYQGLLYEAMGRIGGPRGGIIARFGVGHDNIDKAQAAQNHLVVTNTPGALDASVAEHAMWLMGASARHICVLENQFRADRFVSRTGSELAEKTLGIIGFGAIGRRVARIARWGFGMHVLAAYRCTPEAFEKREGRSHDAVKNEYGLDACTNDVEYVLRNSDIVSLHLSAGPENRYFMDAQRLSRMRPGAILINAARGSLLDENALYDALAGGMLSAAGLDVFESEPYRPRSADRDLRTLENVLLTPHIASNTREANGRMARVCLENIRHFFAGRLEGLNRVDEVL
jgi:lactate dehydrogenase-like 2-hydroxyacid dehydrogenase